ncbi:MAG: PilN domain-containing protein [bacterium]|nr:PilN domain-containing protein [bacterium]
MSVSLNLIPSKLQQQAVVRRALMRWSRILICALAAMATMWGIQSWRSENFRQRLHSLRQQTEPITELKSDIAAAEQQLQNLKTENHQLLRLASPRSAASILAAVSQASKQPEKPIYIERYSFARSSWSEVEDASGGTISLAGTGATDTDISQFVEQLRTCGFFVSVELKSTRAKLVGEIEMREFVLECVLL